MSDELIVSGRGTYSIATDEMLSSASNLQRAADMTRDIAGSVQMVDAQLSVRQMESLGIPAGAVVAEQNLEWAYTELQAIVERAEQMSALVRSAARSYGGAEAFAQGVSRKLAADAAVVFGHLFPAFATAFLFITPTVRIMATLGLAAYALNRTNPQLLNVEQFSGPLNKLISDPAFLLAFRNWVMTVDEFGLGLAGLPPSVVSALSAAGLIGLSTSAGFIQKAGGIVGVLEETPVALTGQTLPAPVVAAQSLEQRVDNIPQPTTEHPEQIRIEKFETPGEPDRFEVYIAGTVDFAVSDSGEPYDGTSNLSLAAHDETAGAIAAAVAAMREAGITSESLVTFSGHSQGAAVAARLAESGEYNTAGLFTVGGNIGQIELPVDVPTVIVEHTDDLVVAAGGLQDNNHALIVQREAFGGRELPEGVPVPAHQLIEYQETARLMDQSDSVEIQEALEVMAQFGRGATTSTVTSYHVERVQP